MLSQRLRKPLFDDLPHSCLMWGICLVLILGMTACADNSADALLRDYVDRLARPLGLTPEFSAEQNRIAAPPRWQSLQIAVPSDSVDGLDFLRLRGCALQTTVARRNSSLGRVAPPSQLLLLELAFLREAPACITQLENEGETILAELLVDSLERKKAALPARIFNATLGSSEFRAFWQTPMTPADYPANTSSLVVTAAEQLSKDTNRWLSGDYEADESRLELALSEIAQGDGGALLRAFIRQASTLGSADKMLQVQIDTGSLCEAEQTSDAAPILRTVVQKFFAGRVQPWLAALNQRYHSLLPPMSRLEQRLHTDLGEALPAEYLAWRRTRDTALSDTLQAPVSHVRQLQLLLGECYAEFSMPSDSTT